MRNGVVDSINQGTDYPWTGISELLLYLNSNSFWSIHSFVNKECPIIPLTVLDNRPFYVCVLHFLIINLFKMKIITSFLLFFLISSFTMAQTKLYRGNSTSYSDCLFTLQANKVYMGNSTSYSDCQYTFEDNKVYKGNSTSYSDCLFTIDGSYM